METCAGIWILLFALHIQGRTHEINTQLNKSARFDECVRAPHGTPARTRMFHACTGLDRVVGVFCRT